MKVTVLTVVNELSLRGIGPQIEGDEKFPYFLTT